jgi:2-polyprenyl-3-methyl-5-hydroxy-6-metoxy-1,4-benzoquinol methylase
LNTFWETNEKNTYDLIFSVSVIEHVHDDIEFVMQISDLLKIGGTCVLTMDYNNLLKEGDSIPAEDMRMYNKDRLENYLLRVIPQCELVDTAEWDHYGTSNYTFATMVFKKQNDN